MASTPGNLRRTPIALVTALALVAGTLAIGLNVASASSAVRKFGATLQSPACIKAGTRVTFVATFKNDSLSNQPLGSAKIDSDDNATMFTGIANIAITSVPTGKTWTAAPDHANPDGVILKATSSASALSPGQSVSVSFSAVAPSVEVVKTWKTFAWQSNSYTTSFTRTTPNPTVLVSATCVGPAANIVFTSGPSDTVAGANMADVKVKVTDSTNNPLSGESVVLTSDGLQGSPTSAQVTDGSGIATFSGASLAVKTAVASGVSMTASDGGLNTSATYNIVPAAPSQVAFTQQPTNTIVDGTIAPAVEVTVKDQYSNPVSNVSLGLIISPTSLAAANNPAPVLTGGDAVLTGPNGVATFSGLSINLSSSGYKLQTTVGGIDSAEFAITSTAPNGCSGDGCTVDLNDNGSTVTAPNGTTMIVENNDAVDCGDGFTGFAGTITIIPSGTADIQVTFDDPAGSPEPTPQVGVTYPFCKGGTGGPVILNWGGTTSHPSTADRCSSTGNTPPCIVSQAFVVGPLNLLTTLLINSDDPPVRH